MKFLTDSRIFDFIVVLVLKVYKYIVFLHFYDKKKKTTVDLPHIFKIRVFSLVSERTCKNLVSLLHFPIIQLSFDSVSVYGEELSSAVANVQGCDIWVSSNSITTIMFTFGQIPTGTQWTFLSPCCSLNSSTTGLLQRWFWQYITLEGWDAIKKH